MSMRFGRISPALALTVGALAIAGCGGSSGGNGGTGTTGTTGSGTTASTSGAPLTVAQWKTQLKKIGGELQNSFAPVKSNPNDPSSWDAAASNLDHINGELAAINPPPKLAGITTALVTGLKPLAGEARTIGNDFKNGNQAQAKTDAVKFETTILQVFQKLQGALIKAQGG